MAEAGALNEKLSGDVDPDFGVGEASLTGLLKEKCCPESVLGADGAGTVKGGQTVDIRLVN